MPANKFSSEESHAYTKDTSGTNGNTFPSETSEDGLLHQESSPTESIMIVTDVLRNGQESSAYGKFKGIKVYHTAPIYFQIFCKVFDATSSTRSNSTVASAYSVSNNQSLQTPSLTSISENVTDNSSATSYRLNSETSKSAWTTETTSTSTSTSASTITTSTTTTTLPSVIIKHLSVVNLRI
jgi:hypothetical protein